MIIVHTKIISSLINDAKYDFVLFFLARFQFLSTWSKNNFSTYFFKIKILNIFFLSLIWLTCDMNFSSLCIYEILIFHQKKIVFQQTIHIFRHFRIERSLVMIHDALTNFQHCVDSKYKQIDKQLWKSIIFASWIVIELIFFASYLINIASISFLNENRFRAFFQSSNINEFKAYNCWKLSIQEFISSSLIDVMIRTNNIDLIAFTTNSWTNKNIDHFLISSNFFLLRRSQFFHKKTFEKICEKTLNEKSKNEKNDVDIFDVLLFASQFSFLFKNDDYSKNI